MSTERDKDGLSADERHFLTTGEASDALVSENKEPETPTGPIVESPPIVPEAVEADDADDADEPVPQGAEQSGQPEQKQRRRVSRREFESERQARLKAEQNLQEQSVRSARVEERLSLLQQALQEPAQPEAQAPVRPDPEQDIFGYTRWLEEQLNSVTSKVNGYEEQIQTGQAEMDNERKYLDSLNNYAGTKPDFVNAYNYLMRSRAAELTARSYQITQEQLQGIMDGKVRIPQPVADALRQEERDLYRGAFEQNRDPADTVYQYATMRGYRMAAAPVAPVVPAAGTPGAPLGGTPAAPKQSAPTATEVIASIQRGQSAATSLSNAGGAAPDTELTPQALADMSEEQFATLFNELQARGDRTKLMQLFGS
jgi:hypothetical protein